MRWIEIRHMMDSFFQLEIAKEISEEQDNAIIPLEPAASASSNSEKFTPKFYKKFNEAIFSGVVSLARV